MNDKIMNNSHQISTLLNFSQPNDFYFIQILKRRKENPDMKLGVKRLKSYSIFSKEEYFKVLPNIIERCEQNNARAYIRLNKQNGLEVSHRCIEQISKNIRLGNIHKNVNVWDSVSGKDGKTKYWILDIDKEHLNVKPNILSDIRDILIHHYKEKRQGNELIYHVIPTVTGEHVLTTPFDTRILNELNQFFINMQVPKIDIQKDANTLIYSNK